MSSITLIIRPYRSPPTSKPVHGRYEARLDGRLICISRQPLLDSARVLAAEAIDPATPIAMRHEGAAHNGLRSTVGKAAKLTIEESAKVGPRIICWKPVSRSDVGAPMRFFGSPLPDTGTPAEHISNGGGDMIRLPTRRWRRQC
jgi:hypothetical protein